MELIVSRFQNHYEGFQIAIKNQDNIQLIAIMNGNKFDFHGPILLTEIDQHIVYGMSHPKVVSRLISQGPQQLLTSKELGHRLFEHGMKASIGKIKVKNNMYLTTLETFYTLATKCQHIIQVANKDTAAYLVQPRSDLKPILISNRLFDVKNDMSEYDHIIIDDIQTHLTKKFYA